MSLKFYLSDSAMQDPELKGFFVPEKIAEYRGFGGVRIEDDIIITKDGCEVIHIYTTKAKILININVVSWVQTNLIQFYFIFQITSIVPRTVDEIERWIAGEDVKLK